MSGAIAPFYDLLLDIASFGRYPAFIEDAIGLMGIGPRDSILDLGAGTGRNAFLMMRYLSREGELIGVDLSSRMIAQFKRKCAAFTNAKIINARIDRPLAIKKNFDKVFVSFVLHGLPQEAREAVVENAFRALKEGGALLILDYSEFQIKRTPFLVRAAMRLLECPYVFDFIKRDWKGILGGKGFHDFEEHFFFSGYVRLLKAERGSGIK